MEIYEHKTYWHQSVVSEKVFTRKRCMSFSTLVLMILNLPKRGLNVELRSFFEHIEQKKCSKSAFCQQRMKLKPYFFELWNRVLIKRFYQYYGERVRRWKGFILLAFDGSVISLPNTAELRRIYGQPSNASGLHGAAARVCLMYDVLNKLIIDSRMVRYLTMERSVVMNQTKHAPPNSLLTFDRGYPCFWLMYRLAQKQQRFVMRIRTDKDKVIRDFMHSSENDCIRKFLPSFRSQRHLRNMGIDVKKDTSLLLRLVKIPLKTGETEVLITNLYSSEMYSIQDLKEVYALRWGVETCFNVLKNQLQIENFSGIRSVCVKQDFFANVFVCNLQSIIEKPCQAKVSESYKNRKYDYQINKSSSWAILKYRMVDLFLSENPNQILLELQALFRQYLEPIRPNRSYPRIRKTAQKNKTHKTVMRYKQAI